MQINNYNSLKLPTITEFEKKESKKKNPTKYDQSGLISIKILWLLLSGCREFNVTTTLILALETK